MQPGTKLKVLIFSTEHTASALSPHSHLTAAASLRGGHPAELRAHLCSPECSGSFFRSFPTSSSSPFFLIGNGN